jgi:hypothetical protein
MEIKEHYGDFACIENGAFRTFYMTCKCGWSSLVKILTGGFSSYYLKNMWLTHIADKPNSQGVIDCKLL